MYFIKNYLLRYPITSDSHCCKTSIGAQSSKPVLGLTSNLKLLNALELSY